LRIRDSALQLALAHTDKKSRDAALMQLDLGIIYIFLNYIYIYIIFFLFEILKHNFQSNEMNKYI